MGRRKLPPDQKRQPFTWKLFNETELSRVKRAAKVKASNPTAYIRKAVMRQTDEDLGPPESPPKK